MARLMRRNLKVGASCRVHGPVCLDPLEHVIGGTRAYDRAQTRREAAAGLDDWARANDAERGLT